MQRDLNPAQVTRKINHLQQQLIALAKQATLAQRQDA